MTNILVDEVIEYIKIADDEKAIKFVTNHGCVIVKVDGDCCSDSWIENVDLPALGFPAKVISVEYLDMPDLGDMEGCDVVAYYGCKIITDKGEMIIDYRNDSNGYYGGNLSWPDDGYFYGGVHGKNVSSENWIDVK